MLFLTLKQFQFSEIIIILLIIQFQIISIVNAQIIVEIPEIGTVKGSLTQHKVYQEIVLLFDWSMQTIIQFLGIPYAESPSGNLRFKSPIARPKWDGIFDATKFGRVCPSKESLQLEGGVQDEDLEDCLNLYVYTKNINDNRAVMVYIHGGGLAAGDGRVNRPDFLLENDIVLVTLQYRLGALGFLSTRTKDIPGNIGVLDLIFALEWVQKNIKYFGGNPNEVTIFGNSAGGCLTSLLAVTPRVRSGLFQRAIPQSGVVLASLLYRNVDPVEEAKLFCVKLKCVDCDKIESVNNCFQQANVSQLVSLNSELQVPFGLTIYDHENVIPKDLNKLVEDAPNRVSLMIGTSAFDGAFLFETGGTNVTPRLYLDGLMELQYENNLSGTLGNLFGRLLFKPQDLDKPKIDLRQMMPTFVDVSSILGFKSPTQRFIELYMRNSPQVDHYLYSFDYEGEFTLVRYMEVLKKEFPFYPFTSGPHHGDDLLYLFPRKKNLNFKDIRMAKLMVNLWTSFAINGRPKAKNFKVIPKLQNPNGPYFRINRKMTIGNNYVDEYFSASGSKRRKSSYTTK